MAIPGSAQPPQTDNVTTGIVLMVGAVATFTIIDACAKYLLAAAVPPMMVVFARYSLSLLYVLGLMWWTGTLTFKSHHPRLQVLRGVLLFASTLMNFIALQYLRLDQTSAIFFSNPLWVCALSPFLLGERIGPRRWAAVVIGFLGVLLIIRPGADGFHWAMLLSVTVAVITSLYQIITRKIGGRDPALVSLLLPSLVGSALAMPMGILNWHVPVWGLVALMLLMGLARRHWPSYADQGTHHGACADTGPVYLHPDSLDDHCRLCRVWRCAGHSHPDRRRHRGVQRLVCLLSRAGHQAQNLEFAMTRKQKFYE